jgi:membrane protein
MSHTDADRHPQRPRTGADPGRREAHRRDATGAGGEDDVDERLADRLAGDGDSHGRLADRPTDVSAKGWMDVLRRVRAEMKNDHVSLLAAGVAFFGLLALVPGLVALLSIYGLVADPSRVEEQVVDALAAAPQEVREMVSTQLRSIAEGAGSGAVIGVIVGLLIALWSASSGIGHLVEAINLAYDETDARGFLRRKGLSLVLTLGAIVFVVVAFGLIALLPPLLAETGLGTAGRWIAGGLRWVVLFGGLLAALAVLYRWAPARENPRWRWTSPGAIAAALLWLLGSIAFSVYTANFGKYNETYGSLGAVVVVMLWLMISAYAVVLGAELNAELERQTVRDTTDDRPLPLGQRGAVVADTVGEGSDLATKA